MSGKRRARPGEVPAFILRAVAHEGDDCLPWPYGINSNGYGIVAGKHAHRVVLERWAGPAPSPRMDAAHAAGICHNRLCVNPRHLRWATRAENVADMAVDGTRFIGVGEGNPSARLTADQIVAIRADRRPRKTIAAEYGITVGHVTQIRTGRRWSERAA